MITIAHLSDLHFAPLPKVAAQKLISKRILGYLSWHRKRKHEHRTEVLDALLNDLKADQPDHICVTGDLTNIALGGEFETARHWLLQAGPADHISIIPGNHDAYVAGALEEGLPKWAEWVTGDDGRMGFPYLRRRGKLSIIGTSSAVATLPAMASGRLGEKQLMALEALLNAEHQAGQFTLIMIHHPPQPGAESPRKALSDAKAFRAMIAHSGAGLILHGHTHRALKASIKGPDGPVPILGCGSSSSIGSHKGPGHYYRLTIDPSAKSDGIRVEHRHYDATKKAFFPSNALH
ncbi:MULTISPECIES: metallophosphoesterase [unclassified Iodidimonas]|jgi:3',5'-cyclic AMP phosphodiesterase CpdA|uniref:metallophosphoesterase family protein n=1 Tax=unclassified Iodidimonas TaxID=2626145 RepID=UPI002482E08B|nr:MULTISPECIES: metallophosphoesterase [unclassified Iodidimonas]